MPIPVKKYYCQFRCGRKASTLSDTLKHEEYCFKNPKNKACAGCKYFEKSEQLYCHKKEYMIENAYNDINEPAGYTFSINGKIKWEGKNLKEMSRLIDFPYKENRIFPRANCPEWEPIEK